MISKITRNCLYLSNLNRYNFGVWAKVPLGPPDVVLGVGEAFKKDTDASKVNLSIGAYRCNNGKPVVLGSVKKASAIIESQGLDNEYLPVSGNEKFNQAATKLAYGTKFYDANKDRIAKCQTLSGTGSLRLGMDFIKNYVPEGTGIITPNLTWPNHNTIANYAGLPLSHYNYYDPSTKSANIEKFMGDLEKAPDGSVVMYHVCAHNPTGCDMTQDQWQKVLDQSIRKKFIPFLDMAYQGFTSGDVDVDNLALRMFSDANQPVVLAQSFAKSMGLYGQRIGCLSLLSEDKAQAEAVVSQLKILARSIWSNPPLHGARIAETILTTPDIYTLWLKEVKEMADRIGTMRASLVQELQKTGTKHDWTHISKQQGMFAYTGLNKDQVDRCIKEYHIYLLGTGRISVAGLNTHNVAYVAKAFHEVTKDSASL